MPSSAPHSAADWESLVGGNWLNKLGVFTLVVGIALALGYSFTRIGPGGRVAASLAVSLAMLAGGVVLERRDRYRVFARGVMAGGWAALYFTVYAMHAIRAARILDNGFGAAVLLFAVAAGMIGHSLRYRSEALTGLAYAIAFGTLGITEITGFSVLALVPLAASLLVVARRFAWRRCALLALAATYAVCASRGDTGAPLWQAQTIFAVYWLLFEAFDLLLPDPRLLPLNAAGFLGLSLVKWSHAAPERLWQFLAGAAAAYLVSALLRARRGSWRPAITLAAMLAAAAVVLHLDRQASVFALMAEAELLYVAGLAFRAPYLRRLGTAIFAFQMLQLPGPHWRTVAALDAALFYGNRALCGADEFFSYAGLAMLAAVMPHRDPGLGSFAGAAVLYAIGRKWRLRDFRYQSYLLAVAGIGEMALTVEPVHSLAIAAVLAYAAAVLGQEPWERLGASAACAGLLAAVAWRTVPEPYVGLAGMALALGLLELGRRGWPSELRLAAYALAAAAAAQVAVTHLFDPRAVPAAAAVLSYAFAARDRQAVASWCGTAFALAALPAAGWPVLAVALLAMRRPEGHVVAGLAFVHACARGFPLPESGIAIASFYGLQLAFPRGGMARLYYAMLANVLLAALLFDRVSGNLLTVVWGAQGLALLAAGFPLHDRVARLAGLGLLAVCLLKLFVYDLRFLDTLPRIFSFLVLGLILVGVSWIYSRVSE
jgi:hypothetical protein